MIQYLADSIWVSRTRKITKAAASPVEACVFKRICRTHTLKDTRVSRTTAARHPVLNYHFLMQFPPPKAATLRRGKNPHNWTIPSGHLGNVRWRVHERGLSVKEKSKLTKRQTKVFTHCPPVHRSRSSSTTETIGLRSFFGASDFTNECCEMIYRNRPMWKGPNGCHLWNYTWCYILILSLNLDRIVSNNGLNDLLFGFIRSSLGPFGP